MVSEQVCNYLMGGLVTLFWVYKIGLILLVVGLIYNAWKYWCRCKYGEPRKPTSDNTRLKKERVLDKK